MKTKIPVDFIFNPNWWYRNYEIPFAEDFYLNKQVRVNNDVSMRRALFERFGFGEPNPQPRPILGSMQVAGGFVVPALLGREIRFSPAEAPVAVTGNLDRKQVMALRVPDIEQTSPISELLRRAAELRHEHGWFAGISISTGFSTSRSRSEERSCSSISSRTPNWRSTFSRWLRGQSKLSRPAFAR